MRGLDNTIENSEFLGETLLEGVGQVEALSQPLHENLSAGSLNLLVAGDSPLTGGVSFLEVLLTQPIAMLELVALVFTVIYLGRLTVFSSSFSSDNIINNKISTKNISTKNISKNISNGLSSNRKRATVISEVGALISKPKISLLGQS